MEEGHFGGQMVVGIRDNFGKVYKVAMVFFEKEILFNTKVHGIMACLMAKVPNISQMVKNTKAHLNKTNSMVMAYFIKMTP
jgi:hypothetical protein